MAKTRKININSGRTGRDGVNADVAKTPLQIYKTNKVNEINSHTRKGEHIKAQEVYNKTFPKLKGV